MCLVCRTSCISVHIQHRELQSSCCVTAGSSDEWLYLQRTAGAAQHCPALLSAARKALHHCCNLRLTQNVAPSAASCVLLSCVLKPGLHSQVIDSAAALAHPAADALSSSCAAQSA